MTPFAAARDAAAELVAASGAAAWGRRRATRSLLLVALLLVGGCRALADEFLWVDRAGPVIERAPDRAPPGDRQEP